MQIIVALGDADVQDAAGRPIYRLREGRRYVLYDCEAGAALRGGAATVATGLDRALPAYRGEPLEAHRLVLPFIGRLGDAIVTASCLIALKDAYPNVDVDVAAPPAARAVFELLPRVGSLLPYPLEAADVDGYDFHLSFEHVEAVPDATARSCADVFSECLRTPTPIAPPTVTIPDETASVWSKAFANVPRPRVAIHSGPANNLRSTPIEQTRSLVRRLSAEGLSVCFVGTHAHPKMRPESDDDRVTNLIGRTTTPADLAAVLAQMDALITCDSFPMHLAGALGVPTIALFTSTDAVIASDYPGVLAVQSKAACSPCRVASGDCPLGHATCIAHDDEAFEAGKIAELTRTAVATPAVTD